MMNQKRALTNLLSCPTMEIPWRQITFWNPSQKKNIFVYLLRAGYMYVVKQPVKKSRQHNKSHQDLFIDNKVL